MLFDVSHEALIRNWDTYRTLLKEVDDVEEALAEVDRNLTKTDIAPPPHADPPSGPLALMQHFWSWLLARMKHFWSWFNEDAEKAAMQDVPDRVRDNLGSVLSAKPHFSRQLAAALLVDLEDQQAARQGKNVPSDRSAETREKLEDEKLLSVEAMEVPWQRARHSARLHIPRSLFWVGLLACGIVVYLGTLVASNRLDAAYQRGLAYQSEAQRYFEEDAASTAFLAASIATALNDGRRLDVAAFELGRAFRKLKKLEYGARYVPSPDKYIDLAERMFEQAARGLSSTVILRPYTASKSPRLSSEQACAYQQMPKAQGVKTTVPHQTLLRNRGDFSFGLKFSGPTGWIFATQSPDSKEPVPAHAPLELKILAESLVCLSADASLAMIWPPKATPQFWTLFWYCLKSDETHCTSWAVDPQNKEPPYFAESDLRSHYYKPNELNGIWEAAAQGTTGVPPDSGIFILQDNQSRTGFAMRSKQLSLLADAGASFLVPSLSSQSKIITNTACEVGTDGSCEQLVSVGGEDLRIVRHEFRRFEGGGSARASPQGCASDAPCVIDIQVFSHVPGETGEHYYRVAAMQTEASPIQQIKTDGTIIYLVDKHRIWQRFVIGHDTLANNVKEFEQGSEPKSDDPQLSLACRWFDCVNW